MNNKPDFTLNFIENNRQPLEVYFSQDLLSKIPERSPQHILVILHQYMDLGALEQMCSPFHHHKGPGRSPTHTIPRLLRALLVGYLNGLSLRQMEAYINANLVAKWFTGYSVFEPAPDHSTIERFEVWLLHNHQSALFDDILRQIDATHPQLAEAIMGDTYALRANAANELLMRLLRHLCLRLIEALKQDDAPAYARLAPLIDRSALFGDEIEKNEFDVYGNAQPEYHQATALAVHVFTLQVHRTLSEFSNEKSVAINNWLACLDKILADKFTFQTDDLGQITVAYTHPKKDNDSF